MNSDLLLRAQHATARAGLDALLVTPGPDLRYLTGYDALPLERLTCLVIPAAGDITLVAPALEVPAAQASPIGAMDIAIRGWDETDSPFALVATLLPHRGTVGLDDHMAAAKVLRLRDAMPTIEQTLAGDVLHELRVIKTAAEVESLAEAAASIDRVHARMSEWLKAGRTEREVGDEIAAAIVAEGHVRVDFVIVGSGPNGASPHHELSDRVIGLGEPVVVDIGGTMPSGYCSDSTRMYCIGDPPASFNEYYGALQQAQAAAVAQVRPGVAAETVDRAARDVLMAAGFGDQFIHRTGHGIGLETHEEPYIVSGNTQPLRVGMTFSIEPGVYLPGQHGARIEDIVVVTEAGVRSLNTRPRHLVVLEA